MKKRDLPNATVAQHLRKVRKNERAGKVDWGNCEELQKGE